MFIATLYHINRIIYAVRVVIGGWEREGLTTSRYSQIPGVFQTYNVGR